MAESKEVIFFSTNKTFKLGADSIQREVRDGGVVITPAKVIEFYQHVYKTSDKKEIEVLKACNEFKTKQLRIISEDEFNKYLKVQAMELADIASRSNQRNNEEAGYDDEPVETGVEA